MVTWAPSIRSKLESEHQAALAAQRREEQEKLETADKERELARNEAIDAKKQELQILKAIRSDTLAALLLVNSMIPSMRLLAKVIEKAAGTQDADGVPLMPVGQAASILTRWMQMVQKAAGAAEIAYQLSRLDRGASTVNVAVTEEMSMDDALAELEAVQGVLDQAKAGRLGPATNVDDVLDAELEETPED